MASRKTVSAAWDIEHIFAAGFAMLVPVFMLGVLATLYENGIGLALVFGGFGVAGLIWIRQEIPAALAYVAQTGGLRGLLG